MILNRSRMHKIGWAMILAVCFLMLLALTFKVNAVKSQVRLTERSIMALRQDKDLLETEFETRSSQHQLTALNDVEFGYAAPTPRQYLEGERQLASLGKPRSASAPAPLVVASNEGRNPSMMPAMVNPLTGTAQAAEAPRKKVAQGPVPSELGARLSHVDHPARPDRNTRESVSE